MLNENLIYFLILMEAGKDYMEFLQALIASGLGIYPLLSSSRKLLA